MTFKTSPPPHRDCKGYVLIYKSIWKHEAHQIATPFTFRWWDGKWRLLHPGTKGDFIFHQALFQLNSAIEVSYLVLRTSYSWLVKYLPCKHEDLNWSQELMVKVDCGGSCLQSQSWGGPLEFAGSQSNWISKLQVQQEPLFKEKMESDWGSHSLSTSGLHTHKLHIWSGFLAVLIKENHGYCKWHQE